MATTNLTIFYEQIIPDLLGRIKSISSEKSPLQSIRSLSPPRNVGYWADRTTPYGQVIHTLDKWLSGEVNSRKKRDFFGNESDSVIDDVEHYFSERLANVPDEVRTPLTKEFAILTIDALGRDLSSIGEALFHYDYSPTISEGSQKIDLDRIVREERSKERRDSIPYQVEIKRTEYRTVYNGWGDDWGREEPVEVRTGQYQTHYYDRHTPQGSIAHHFKRVIDPLLLAARDKVKPKLRQHLSKYLGQSLPDDIISSLQECGINVQSLQKSEGDTPSVNDFVRNSLPPLLEPIKDDELDRLKGLLTLVPSDYTTWTEGVGAYVLNNIAQRTERLLSGQSCFVREVSTYHDVVRRLDPDHRFEMVSEEHPKIEQIVTSLLSLQIREDVNPRCKSYSSELRSARDFFGAIDEQFQKYRQERDCELYRLDDNWSGPKTADQLVGFNYSPIFVASSQRVWDQFRKINQRSVA